MEVEVPFERIVTIQVPVVSSENGRAVLFSEVLRVRAPTHSRTHAFLCLTLDHPFQEKIVYKDVPVPVHMSNERVVVKEVPGECECECEAKV